METALDDQALSDLEKEILQARRMLETGQAELALAAAEAMNRRVPQNRDVMYLMAVSQRYLNLVPDALATLEHLENLVPSYSRLFEERGHCRRALGDTVEAIAAYQRAVDINDALPASWQALRDLLSEAGRHAEAEIAARCRQRLANLPATLAEASSLLNDGELDAAETLVRRQLREHGPHADGMRLLAQIAVKLDIFDDAEFLLQNVVELAPEYHDARYEYVSALLYRRKYRLALHHARHLLQVEPDNSNYKMACAKACEGLGKFEEALGVYRELLTQLPSSGELRLNVAFLQRMQGNAQQAIESYQAAAQVEASFSSACLALANMKTYRFTDTEILRMRQAEAAQTARPVDRCPMCFALGKALEDRAEYAESFRYYERGNALKKSELRYKPEVMERSMQLQAEVFTREFFASRQGSGCDRADPIFILGLPRAGSTLLEQILASHSQVDGTMELPVIPHLSRQFRDRSGDATPRYPAVLTQLSPEEFQKLGHTYLEETRVYRGSAPFFIDKMPSNFRDIGLIQLILPNAKIIDARREPMACCFGNFKQLFTNGQEFTYGLEDIGRYYRNYLDLMNHWDRALPGKILRVQHEDLVDDLEGNVRRILEYCNLDFESACLDFYKTKRSVRTVSSEQVRRPIYREGLDQWRNYEPWLQPLKTALGRV